MAATLTIGELAERTGCKVPTIRYYEDIGLIPAPARTAGNQRRYAARHLERLAFVRHARSLGFHLDAIRELLSLSDDPNHACADVDRIARRQRDEIGARIARLQALRAELDRMIRDCTGGKVAECRIMEVLADHGQCMASRHGDNSASRGRRGATPRCHER